VTEPAIDLQRIRREIEAEVRARRASGEYPPGFTRELDDLFARFSPPEASDNFDAAVERAEEAVAIELVIPTASNKPGVGLFKRVVAKLISWYHMFLAQQIGALGGAITHALHLLGNRVDEVERLSGHAERARAEGSRFAAARDDTVWTDAVVGALAGSGGRVAVCEAGDGELVAALVAAGVDAYGVEPRFEIADAAIARGLEIRVDDARGHLRSCAPGDLAGIVLRGCVERLAVGELFDLVDIASGRLAEGGHLVVASVSPSAWGRGRTEVEADLAAGRPLHAATWVSILTARGFEQVTSTAFASSEQLVPLPSSHPDASLINDNLTRISTALYGDDSYVVVARRASR